ncbi:MAG: TerB family tellurite resistance protein [Bacteroidetes bacterium]|nr:TerB family tellurite resistance protein [Bacteroidota bacterium]MBL7103650.1 TerB family tellurite resistance protein [Bacteroidales bacterium]
MNKTEFKKLLFKVAFCAMACDGIIQPEEIEEMKIMDKKTSFFEAIDLSGELTQLIKELDKKGTKVIEELFVSLKNNDLNTIQELLVLEVALRIINADKYHDENEIKFIHLLRAKLEIHDETINDRFGKVDILHTNEYSQNIQIGKTDIEFIESIKFPDLSVLKEIDLNVKQTE